MRDATGPPPSPVRRRLIFRASSVTDGPAHAVVVPARGSDGDPTIGGATLDVYNAAGSGERVTITLPAGGWSAFGDGSTPSGYHWAGSPRADPVSRVTVRANHLYIRAGGASWTYTLNEAAQRAVALRLRLGTAVPRCASVPAKPSTTGAYDHVDRFVGTRNTLAVACPSLP